MSRLTSIEGLHLINYDPASVKANELAIIEYNRLRTLYCQNAENINVQMNQYHKVKDQLWALPITSFIDKIQEESECRQHTSLLSIKGRTHARTHYS